MTKKRLYEISWVIAGLIGYYLIIHILNTTCILKYLTGISCAGCGMSRACLSLLKGNISEALAYHPLVLFLPAFGLVILFRDKFNKKVLNAIYALMLLMFIVVYIKRLIDPYDLIVTCNISDSVFMKIIRGITDVLSKLWK